MRLLPFLLVLLMGAGCSAVYRSPSVSPGVDAGTAVRVVQLNGETVLLANRAPYQPRTLPAIFSMTAGTGGAARGTEALPDPPSGQGPGRGGLVLRPPPAIDPGPYRIGIGDVVMLATPATRSTVAELSGLLAAQNSRSGYTVQDDGAINIPDVGRVGLAGLTVDEAEAAVFQRLVENQINPSFSLEISAFNAKRVSVGGAVRTPAVLPVTLTPLYLDEALTAAGSVSVPDLDYGSIRIYRDGALYQIPLNDFYASGRLQRTRLVAGDSVFVDTEFQLDRAESYFEQQIRLRQTRLDGRALALDELSTEVNLRRADLGEARANFQTQVDMDAVDQDFVYLTGEVQRQSRYPLPFGRQASLADALFERGEGIANRTGDVSEVYVLRASTDPREMGAVTAWHLDARQATNLTVATRFELRPDDVIFVAENPVTRWGRTVSQITPTLITAPLLAAAN